MFVPVQPGRLELLVVEIATGAQPEVTFVLKFACTAGTTQIVLELVSGSQELLKAIKRII
jgi:hypothetical protein